MKMKILEKKMKINFKYSIPYDEMLSSMKGEELSSSQNMIAKNYIKELNQFWEKESLGVFNAIEKISGLKFKKNVDCYIVSDMAFEAISHPFTLKMCLDFKRLKGILIHELLHVLFVQNDKKILKAVNKLDGDRDYKIHFPVLLCERKVLERLNGNFKVEKRVEDLEHVWRGVNRAYPGFKNYKMGVVDFILENAAC